MIRYQRLNSKLYIWTQKSQHWFLSPATQKSLMTGPESITSVLEPRSPTPMLESIEARPEPQYMCPMLRHQAPIHDGRAQVPDARALILTLRLRSIKTMHGFSALGSLVNDTFVLIKIFLKIKLFIFLNYNFF